MTYYLECQQYEAKAAFPFQIYLPFLFRIVISVVCIIRHNISC